ncbi:MAG: hypothetical protein J0H71_05290 [Rhizobiales bacterium]|nr:hypothetical protein [Hyphomicrobiales bacterium]
MPKAACECNSLTASGANKPHGDDLCRFSARPRSIDGIRLITATARTNSFKILLYNDFLQKTAGIQGSDRHHLTPRLRHGGGLQIAPRHAIYTPTAAFVRQVQSIR